MHRYIFFLMFFISLSVYSQDDTIHLNWLTNVEKAKKISKKTKKPILIYFNGSDWCVPCKKLKEDFFETREFEKRSKELILVMIDKPRRLDIISEEQMKYNDKIIAKYNAEKNFPRLVIINYNGKVLDEISGYSYYGETTNHFAFLDRNM